GLSVNDVKNRLGVQSFDNLSKEQLEKLARMLPDLDPEVLKNIEHNNQTNTLVIELVRLAMEIDNRNKAFLFFMTALALGTALGTVCAVVKLLSSERK
ncbi:hypothetical protein IJT17_05625, partial [bacterium]|nr:hypothetical protein [bacterium]